MAATGLWYLSWATQFAGTVVATKMVFGSWARWVVIAGALAAYAQVYNVARARVREQYGGDVCAYLRRVFFSGCAAG